MANLSTNPMMSEESSDRGSASKTQLMFRKAVIKKLEGINFGSLTLEDPIGSTTFQGLEKGPAAHISIHDMDAYKEIALGGSIGAAESYMTKDWDSSNLRDVIRFMTLNMDVLESMEGGLTKVFMPLLKVSHWLNRNTTKGAQRNIAAHYDLGNDFFELFLDPTMTYSSGIFPSENSSLKDASENKMRVICEALQIKSSDHVVEIGSGWGSMAIYMAEKYGCRVTTTTISRAQYEYAAQRIKEKGLDDKINLLLKDYRDLIGTNPLGYDKLVSIEMIEAVGHQYYDEYFSIIDKLLRPDGMALIQAITIEDHRYELAKGRVDFIQKYIFPGSCIPSIAAMGEAVKNNTKMRLIKQYDFAQHYAKTLNRWHQKLLKNWNSIQSIGYSETFLRMWQFYLCYCEGGFTERAIGVSHLVYAKPRNRASLKIDF